VVEATTGRGGAVKRPDPRRWSIARMRTWKIGGLLIDTGDCHLVYVVLSIGGFMGVANKLFAMP